jgi:hypothetical protein
MTAYEKTTVKILDINDTEVWSGTIESDHGVFQENLKRGAYHLIADNPLTIQFGYLDDENFSVLYGKPNKINAYAFGDLMISSLYPNTKVTLKYGNEKISKQEFSFKQAGITQIVSLIELFSPKNPEHIFVSLTFNNPILAFTFSSGNNFGGEYIPGKNGLMADTDFSFVTLRVSPEFSKEQKNLIELIGLENNTNITATGAWKQKVVLQEKSTYIFPSNTPMEKIILNSDKPFQVSQIHNSNTKGLFYWIPPINDKSIQVEIGNQTGEAMIQNSSTFDKNLQFLLNKQRLHDFWVVTKNNNFLAMTIFFSSLMLLLLFLIFWIWFSYGKTNSNKRSIINMSELASKEIEDIKNQLFEDTVLKPITIEETPQKEEKKQSMPPSLPINIVFPKIKPLLSDDQPVIPHITNHETDTFPSRDRVFKEESKETPVIVSQNLENQNSFLNKLKENKIVLDPGSANRLYVEGKLTDLTQVYMVKSSSKKITTEVTDKINKVDLNMQDMSKANVYKDSLSTFEEAGKALSLCKKLKISYYITSYKLPSLIQGIHVIYITDAIKTS